MMEERYERGLAVYASQFQIPPEAVAEWFTERVGQRFGKETILAAADAWVNDELSLRDRSLVVIAALVTLGGAEQQQLRVHTRWAIEHGFTRVPARRERTTYMREELARLEAA